LSRHPRTEETTDGFRDLSLSSNLPAKQKLIFMASGSAAADTSAKAGKQMAISQSRDTSFDALEPRNNTSAFYESSIKIKPSPYNISSTA
jgi:hypothetical protein